MSDENDEFICDSCQEPSREEFGDPSGERTLCYKCYETAFYEKEKADGIAWIKAKLPTMEEFVLSYCRLYGYPNRAHFMSGCCHQAALLLHQWLNARDCKVQMKRGHWIGKDVRHPSIPFQQHSWCGVEVPVAAMKFYVDPTQWVFTGVTPEISIVPDDDPRYDYAKHKVRQAFYGYKVPARFGKCRPSGLSVEAQQMLDRVVVVRNWTKWCKDEMHEIANRNPDDLGGCALEIFEAIKKAGHIAFIPFTTVEQLWRGGHHP